MSTDKNYKLPESLIPPVAGTLTNTNKRTVTSNYTVQSSDSLILANAAAGTFTVTLPAATSNQTIMVVKTDAVNNVNVGLTGADTYPGGSTNYILNFEGHGLIFVSNGTNKWFTF